MIEETKLSLSRNEAICTLVMLVRIAADSFSASELEETLEGGFGCLMKLGVSSAEIEAAAVYLSVMSKKEKESHE
jgi:hypothetical protein